MYDLYCKMIGEKFPSGTRFTHAENLHCYAFCTCVDILEEKKIATRQR